MPVTHAFATLFIDDSFVGHITFVAENHSLDILVRMLINVTQPFDYVLEALLVRYVVHQHDSHGCRETN